MAERGEGRWAVQGLRKKKFRPAMERKSKPRGALFGLLLAERRTNERREGKGKPEPAGREDGSNRGGAVWPIQ